MPYDRDILVRLWVKKDGRRAAYGSQRNTATDFPVIACAVLAPVISNLLIESTLLTIKLLRFGPLSVLFMAAVALFTATISTLVPVAVYSRKPPVESIRAL